MRLHQTILSLSMYEHGISPHLLNFITFFIKCDSFFLIQILYLYVRFISKYFNFIEFLRYIDFVSFIKNKKSAIPKGTTDYNLPRYHPNCHAMRDHSPPLTQGLRHPFGQRLKSRHGDGLIGTFHQTAPSLNKTQNTFCFVTANKILTR